MIKLSSRHFEIFHTTYVLLRKEEECLCDISFTHKKDEILRMNNFLWDNPDKNPHNSRSRNEKGQTAIRMVTTVWCARICVVGRYFCLGLLLLLSLYYIYLLFTPDFFSGTSTYMYRKWRSNPGKSSI